MKEFILETLEFAVCLLFAIALYHIANHFFKDFNWTIYLYASAIYLGIRKVDKQ